MIGTRSFTIPASSKMLGFITSVLTLGTLALVLLSVAAIVAAAYIINLLLTVLVSLSIHIATLYNGSDSIVKLLILCIAGWILVKLFPFARRSLAASFGRI